MCDVDMSGISSDYIGMMCQEFRRYVLKESQRNVAISCSVSRETVSKFERGTIANSKIFMWYIKKGIFDWVPVERWCGWIGYCPDSN